MQDEDEAQTGTVATEINLDVIEEVLGDDTILIEEDEDSLLIKTSSCDDEDNDIDIAFHANDEKYW